MEAFQVGALVMLLGVTALWCRTHGWSFTSTTLLQGAMVCLTIAVCLLIEED